MDEHMHHSMGNSSGSGTPPTVASTLMQTFVTTVMASGVHHNHSMMEADMSTVSSVHDHMSNTPNIVDHSKHLSGSHFPASDHNMVMYFHSGVDTVILFKEWTTSSSQGLFGSVIIIFLMAMLYEGIKFFREFMFKKYFTSLEYSSVSVLGDDGKTVTEVHKVARNRMFSWPHTMQTVLHVVQMVLSYFLMLIFMTYNVWLCLGVVSGAGAGYFLFGWKKATVVDITEHCH